MNTDLQFNSLSRESTIEDSYYIDPITGQSIYKPANKPPDYLRSPVSTHATDQTSNIYSPSTTHPTSTVKTTGSLVNTTIIKSPRRQQPQVPPSNNRRRASLERQVRLDDENELVDEQGNRKDSYESYTTSLGDEEDRDLEFYDDSNMQNTYLYPNNNQQWLNQQQPKTSTISSGGRTLPQPKKSSNYFDQSSGQVFPQRSFFDQQKDQFKENEQPTYLDLTPNEPMSQITSVPTSQQQLTNQTGQLAPIQTINQSNKLGSSIPKSPILDQQFIDQQRRLSDSNNVKKEQWRQNKNETTLWQTVSEDENYDDIYMEQHLQQQKQKQAFGVLQPPLIEETSVIDQTITPLDIMNQNKKNTDLIIDQQQIDQTNQQQQDQFDKREQWKNLPEQQTTLWKTADSEDKFDTSIDQQAPSLSIDDDSLAMLGGLQSTTVQTSKQQLLEDNFESESNIIYDDQTENEKLFDQFDSNKQKTGSISGPPSALRNQNLIGFQEPKTVTFSDQVQEESYEVISESSTTKGLNEPTKQIRTDPYTGQPIIDNDNFFMDEQTDKSHQPNDFVEQSTDYLDFEQQQQQKQSENLIDDHRLDTDQLQLTTDQEIVQSSSEHLTEQPSNLVEFAPQNTEGLTPARIKWLSAFNKIVSEMQDVSLF